MPGGPLIIQLPPNWSHPPIPPFSNWSDLTPANTNCTYGIQWIYNFMGQCVMDGRGIAAMVCGFICLFAWILNGIPQMIENFRSGIPDQALSPFMLLFWTLGDLSNFVGCILAHQLILQVVVSVYSIANDFILVSQFIYYKSRHQVILSAVSDALGDGRVSIEDAAPDDCSPESDDHQALLPSASTKPHARHNTRTLAVCFVGVVGLTACATQTLNGQSGDQWAPHMLDVPTAVGGATARRLLQLTLSENQTGSNGVLLGQAAFLPDTQAKIGYLLGCISTVMYLSSRFPQIIRNWRRGSTEGLCLGLFCLAVIGNASYGLQIFLTSLYPTYLLQSLPWIIGSVGVLGLDFVICSQFYYYSSTTRKSPDSTTRSESRRPSAHTPVDQIAPTITESV